jgi:MoaA/NifB/PqqE/SkfB family radical SAM enzyme
MKLSLIHWHIELSSICTLKCPRCPRAELPDSLLNKQLTLAFFQTQITASVIKDIKKITFCGNDGDPIYCKDVIEIIKWIKDINPSIVIVLVTNGSHKKDVWWRELGVVLNEYDEIHWSLDGWDQQSNEIYRVNSDWESTINGIRAFSEVNSTTYKVWDTIVFKFNEERIADIEQLARINNFDLFQLTLSTKFGSKYPDAYSTADALEPSGKFIPDGHRFEREFTNLSNKKRFSENIKDIYKGIIKELPDPKLCFIGNKGVFLNSHGEFYPCCWTANRYEHNKSWLDLGKSKFNLHNRTFKEIINDEFWSNDFLKFDSWECKTKCNSSMLEDKNYILDW